MPEQGNDGGTEQSSSAPSEPKKIEIIPLEPKKITKRSDPTRVEKRRNESSR